MKISNFVKFTSVCVLCSGIFLLSGTNALAANKKVEDDVHATVNSIMQKNPSSSGAKRLENSELAGLRERKANEIKSLKNDYGDIVEKINELTEQIKSYSIEAGQYKATLADKLNRAGNITYGAAAVSAVLPIPGSRVVGAVLAGGAFITKRIASWLDNPEATRAAVDALTDSGSYTSTLKQLGSNISEINFSPAKLREGQKKDEDVAKAEELIAKYNAAVKQVHKYINDLMPGVQRLDQLIEEFSDLPLTIGAGQELYSYQIWEKDADGNPKFIGEYYFVMDEDGTLKSIDGVTQGCIPLQAKLAEAQSCIFCPLFKIIFNAAQGMSTKSYDKLASPLANVLLIGFALVIAFMVLKNVSSFTKQDAPKFITELLVNVFKVLITFYLLKNSSIVYGYIIGPVLKAGFEFGSGLLFASKGNYLSSCAALNTSSDAIVGVMPTYLYTYLDCFIKAIQAEVAIPQSIGSSLMCVARNAGKSDFGPLRNVMWDFSMMFQGLIIWIMGWIMSLAFAFYLIDATMQLGILGALMPFLIACWPFKVTRSYTSKGWGMFMGTFFVYVFMGLVVSINIELIGQALTGSAGGFDAIQDAINGNSVAELKRLLDIGFAGFLVLIACCLFAWKLTGKASELAGTMSDGAVTNFGGNIGGLAANVATRATQGTLKSGLGAAKVASDKIGLTGMFRKGMDTLKAGALGAVGLGRKSGAAGNKAAQNSYKKANANNGGAAAQTPNSFAPDANNSPANNLVAQNQVKKMAQSGPRTQKPATPENQNPEYRGFQNQNDQVDGVKVDGVNAQNGPISGGQAPSNNQSQNSPKGNESHTDSSQKPAESQRTHAQQTQKTDENSQLQKQLEKEYEDKPEAKAKQNIMKNLENVCNDKFKLEKQAFDKMNYHNNKSDEYLKEAQKATDPAQKKNFEDMANAQFEEAVKAEAVYNKASQDAQKSLSELNSIYLKYQQEQKMFVQNEMNKRSKKYK